MAQRRWAEVITTHEGTEINLWPIPFEGAQPLDMPSEQARVASSVVNPLPSEQATDKKVLRTLSSKEEEGPTGSNLKQELIQTWNEHKPSAWPALKAISAPRDKTVRKLGGYRAVIDLLPDAMRGAKASKFWNAKGFTWENFMGDKIPKGHIQSLAESAPTSSSSNKASYSAQEHPDFFPPCPVTGDMRPKHGFTDAEHRKASLESARAFYSQLTEG